MPPPPKKKRERNLQKCFIFKTRVDSRNGKSVLKFSANIHERKKLKFNSTVVKVSNARMYVNSIHNKHRKR